MRETKTVVRDGVKLAYTDTGAGDPALMFVHGWTCNATNWRDQVPHFAKKHRVVAVDLRGHGQSGKPDQDYTIDGFVDDVAWLIEKLGLERPVIIGHSMGGTIALNLAHKHPQLTSAIVMVDSPVVPLPEAAQGLVGPLFAGLQTPAYATVAEGFARTAFFGASTPPALVDELIAGIVQAPQRLMHTAIASVLAESSMPAGPIPVPALYIRAAEPSITTEDSIRGRYPGLGVITVPAAHFVQMEQPATTNSIIAGFLDKLE